MTSSEARAFRFLEHLADAEATVVKDLDGFGVARDDIAAVLRDLERSGYVDLEPRRTMSLAQAYPGARITSIGANWVEELREHQADPVARARACRTELLLWLYDTDEHMPVTLKLLELDRTYYGAPFTERDVNAAAKYLYDLRLISGVGAESWGAGGAPLRSAITTAGRSRVEDHDADPDSEGRPPVSSTIYQQTINNPTGSIAQGEGATAVTHHGLTPADIEQLRETFTRGLRTLEDPEEREEVEQAIQDVLDALQADAVDDEHVRRRVRSLQRLAASLSNAALTAAATEGGKQALELLTNRF